MVKPCPRCNKSNPLGCVLFKRNAIFLNHASDLKYDLHSTQTQTEELILNKTEGPLAVCKDCCERILRLDSENSGTNKFVGYLTTRQHREYRTYANKSDELHYRGYVVTKRKVSMNLGFLMHLIMKNKKNITPLIKGNDEPTDKNRMWVELKTKLVDKNDHVELKNNRDQLGSELGKIINPDAFFGKLAQRNRNYLLNVTDVDDVFMVKYEVAGEGVLYRSTREKGKQVIHKDAQDYSYNIVEALTCNYSNVIFPHTHLLESWDSNNRPKIYGTGEKVTLQDNEMLVMHSNTIHCGGSSCGIINNFDRCRKKMKKEYSKLLKKRKEELRSDEPAWFLTGQNANLKISDMSIHRTVDAHIGRTGSSEMVTGKTSIFPAIHIPEISDISDEKYLNYIGRIKQGKCLYRQASEDFWPHGNKVPMDYPCSRVINEAGISVERLVTGAHVSTRRSMRVEEQEKNGTKRKEPDHNGLSYCTCADCCQQKSEH